MAQRLGVSQATINRIIKRVLQCKLRNFVTTDEAMFYLGGSYGRRRVCNYRKGGVEDVSKHKFVKRDSF